MTAEAYWRNPFSAIASRRRYRLTRERVLLADVPKRVQQGAMQCARAWVYALGHARMRVCAYDHAVVALICALALGITARVVATGSRAAAFMLRDLVEQAHCVVRACLAAISRDLVLTLVRRQLSTFVVLDCEIDRPTAQSRQKQPGQEAATAAAAAGAAAGAE
eukprot:2181466-Pleurochrysis_carterae.AAC.1